MAVIVVKVLSSDDALDGVPAGSRQQAEDLDAVIAGPAVSPADLFGAALCAVVLVASSTAALCVVILVTSASAARRAVAMPA